MNCSNKRKRTEDADSGILPCTKVSKYSCGTNVIGGCDESNQGKAAKTKLIQHVSYSSRIGDKKYQEDRTLVQGSGITDAEKLYAVFDGHGRAEAAEFAKNNFELALNEEVRKLDHSHVPEEYERALKLSFQNLHSRMKKVSGQRFCQRVSRRSL